MITEASIRNSTNLQSYSRGEEYCDEGMVISIVRRGDAVLGEVLGSAPTPYHVSIVLARDDVVSATCTCPYDWGDYCKHIVAVLLATIREPEQIEERVDLDTLLADVDADTLRRLIHDLLIKQPDLIPWFEAQLALRRSKATAPPGTGRPSHPAPAKVAVDAKVIRRLVRSAMQTSGDYYATGSVVAGLNEVLQLAGQALEAGDGAAALTIVEIIGEATIPGWEEYDDSDGEFGGWFDDLGAVLTEALLSADLTATEREEWATQVDDWQSELSDYGVDEAFGGAKLAIRQGWAEPQLILKLAGQYDNAAGGAGGGDEAGSDDEPEDYEYEELYSDALTAARLNVLERQGRIEEYLNLARTEGEAVRYAIMLVKLGRMQEALAYGLQNLISCDEALPVAVAFQQQGEHNAALQVGAHGLGLVCGQPAALARWVREAAAAQGEHTLALRAARVAFEAAPMLADFRAIQTLAGADWPDIKPALLAHLAASPHAPERTDIYLAEGMVDAAIQALGRLSYVHYSELEKVAVAAIESHPDWVIRQCRNQAEPIMDAAKSTHYPAALHWLDIARRALLAAGRSQEWRTYCESLLATHARKYRLTPGLKDLLRK
jgi:uncharacterized Zn finger protein